MIDNYIMDQSPRITMTLSEILANTPPVQTLAQATDVPGANLEWMKTAAYLTGAWFGDLGELGTTGFRDSLFTGYLASGVTCRVSGVPYSWSGSAWAAVGGDVLRDEIAAKVVRKIGGAVAGLNDFNIGFVGDSTTAGELATGTQRSAFPRVIHKIIKFRNFANVRQGWIVYGANSRNPDWDIGTWTFGGKIGCGGINGSGMVVSGFGDDAWDVCDVILAKISGGGTVTATATGGTPVVTNVSGASMVMITVTAASASASNQITFSSSGSGYVMAVRPRLSTEKAIRIGNFGSGGSKSVDWAATSTTGGVPTVIAAACDMWIISLGANDASSSVSPSVYSSQIAALAAACATKGIVVLASPIRSQSSTLANFEKLYAIECMKLAEANGYFYFDLGGVIGNYDPAVFADSLHPNTLGHAQIGQALQHLIFGGCL